MEGGGFISLFQFFVFNQEGEGSGDALRLKHNTEKTET